MCIAAFLRNNFKLLCKQSFTYKTEMICSLVPSEEFELLELFACMASVQFSLCKNYLMGSLGGPVVKRLTASAGDMGSIPGPGISYMLWSD